MAHHADVRYAQLVAALSLRLNRLYAAHAAQLAAQQAVDAALDAWSQYVIAQDLPPGPVPSEHVNHALALALRTTQVALQNAQTDVAAATAAVAQAEYALAAEEPAQRPPRRSAAVDSDRRRREATQRGEELDHQLRTDPDLQLRRPEWRYRESAQSPPSSPHS